jgi:hypothetical protein
MGARAHVAGRMPNHASIQAGLETSIIRKKR